MSPIFEVFLLAGLARVVAIRQSSGLLAAPRSRSQPYARAAEQQLAREFARRSLDELLQ